MEKKKFWCIFNQDQQCPVKQEYKLQPESLVEFCKVCRYNKALRESPSMGQLLEMAKVLMMLREDRVQKQDLGYELQRIMKGPIGHIIRSIGIEAMTLEDKMKEVQAQEEVLKEKKAWLMERMEKIRRIREKEKQKDCV